jgi:hypothetical protein
MFAKSFQQQAIGKYLIVWTGVIWTAKRGQAELEITSSL